MTIINKAKFDVIIFDDLNPEAAAMVLAMYSRDPRSVKIHLDQVKEVGPEKFMSQYYVGYGHKSIGDCGSTTICAENISMLAAKAVQQNPMYNGQEASTRYLKMTEQDVLNPLGENPEGTDVGKRIQERWMKLYNYVLEELVPNLKQRYPALDGENPKQYEKAIKAKAFDIARAFLPAGCTTYVGWHTNLRQAWDHIKEMTFHPLEEVRSLAKVMLSELQKKYSSSFNFKSYPLQDAYLKACSEEVYQDLWMTTPFEFTDNFDHTNLAQVQYLLKNRPEKTELPDWFNRYGQIQFKFVLDFGSFRDIQRHRSCTQIMPLLMTDSGFNTWYLDSLPKYIRENVTINLEEQEFEIRKINDPIVRQYYIAMGYNVICELTAGLPSAVYIAELRSGQTVHPTLRPVAQQMGKALKSIFPEIALHCDYSPDEWSTVRGKHDIVKKSE